MVKGGIGIGIGIVEGWYRDGIGRVYFGLQLAYSWHTSCFLLVYASTKCRFRLVSMKIYVGAPLGHVNKQLRK